MRQLLFATLLILIFNFCTGQKKPVKKINSKSHSKMEIQNITKENLQIPELDSLIKQENIKVLNSEKDSSRIVTNNIKNYEFTIQNDPANFEYFKYTNGQDAKKY